MNNKKGGLGIAYPKITHNSAMSKLEKLCKKIKKTEHILVYATPSQTAKLTKKIVKWKGQVCDEL